MASRLGWRSCPQAWLEVLKQAGQPTSVHADAADRVGSVLDRFVAGFPGPNSNAVVHRQDKDFTIADLATRFAATTLQDGFDGGIDEVLVDSDLQLDFAQQIDAEFSATIVARLALLSSKALAV